jgi:hypothetical protein
VLVDRLARPPPDDRRRRVGASSTSRRTSGASQVSAISRLPVHEIAWKPPAPAAIDARTATSAAKPRGSTNTSSNARATS